jgi:hypothetical protein
MRLKRKRATSLFVGFFGLAFLVTACSQSGIPSGSNEDAARGVVDKYDDYQIVTLLPQDAIQAIDQPKFLSVAEADEKYEPQEMILGVEFNGDARAYSVPFLSSHEIVNDTVGGVAIAVTW